jgi:hypothetical protein
MSPIKELKSYDFAYILVAAFIVTYFLFFNWNFLSTLYPHQLSSHSNFTLDGHSYWNGAQDMIEKGDIFFTKDIYHSPGGQIWISWILRFFENPSPLIIKKINYVFFIIILTQIFFFVKETIGWRYSILSLIFLSSSSYFRTYIATIQYEILLCLIITSMLLIFTLNIKKHQLTQAIVLALLCFICFMIRYHYLYFAFISMLFLWKTKFSKLSFFSLYAVLLTLFLTSYIKNDLGLNDLKQNSEKQLRWLSPLSGGHNYPYPQEDPAIKPGFQYIVSHPVSYLNQLFNRFCYLFGLKEDSYFLPSNLSKMSYFIFGKTFDLLIAILEVTFILIGFILSFKFYRKIAIAYCSIAAAFYLPILIVGATSRFIIPLMPIHLFFIILTLKHGYEFLLKRYSDMPDTRLKILL